MFKKVSKAWKVKHTEYVNSLSTALKEKDFSDDRKFLLMTQFYELACELEQSEKKDKSNQHKIKIKSYRSERLENEDFNQLIIDSKEYWDAADAVTAKAAAAEKADPMATGDPDKSSSTSDDNGCPISYIEKPTIQDLKNAFANNKIMLVRPTLLTTIRVVEMKRKVSKRIRRNIVLGIVAGALVLTVGGVVIYALTRDGSGDVDVNLEDIDTDINTEEDVDLEDTQPKIILEDDIPDLG